MGRFYQGFARAREYLGGAICELWLFPVIETFHLLALSVMGGMLLAVISACSAGG